MSHKQIWSNFPDKFYCARYNNPHAKLHWYTHNTSQAWKRWVLRAEKDDNIQLYIWHVNEARKEKI